MARQFHKDGSKPKSGWVFVFGSNLAGRHGKGAAQAALEYGARYGNGRGRQGNAYALPTKDGTGDVTNLQDKRSFLTLAEIAANVAEFIAHAQANPQDKFFVTRVGCDLAGNKDADIASLFMDAPDNCSFAQQWSAFLSPAPVTPKPDTESNSNAPVKRPSTHRRIF